MYDFNTGTFLPAKDGTTLTRKRLKEVLNHPGMETALDQARRELGVPNDGGSGS